MISLKIGGIIVAAFLAGAFFAPPVQQAIAAVIATDVQCTGCVGTSDLAGNAVTSPKIKDGEVKAADLGAAAVTNPKIANGAVNSAKIADGTIVYGDVSRNLIAVEHRVDCNCGGTGWDPDGTSTFEQLYDDRITTNSVVAVTSWNVAITCSTTTNNVVIDGSVMVRCSGTMPNFMGINYAIFSNPAYS